MVGRTKVEPLKSKLKEHAEKHGGMRSKHMREMVKLLNKHKDKSLAQVHKMVVDKEKQNSERTAKIMKGKKENLAKVKKAAFEKRALEKQKKKGASMYGK